jgi:hypothetical protein
LLFLSEPIMDTRHVNRSLRTSTYNASIRMSRPVAFEIESMFDATRPGGWKNGMKLLPQPIEPALTSSSWIAG